MIAAFAVLAQLNFDSDAAPLSLIVPRLSAVVGRPLRVSPELAWRILFIRAKNAEPKSLMSEVAYAAGGVWTPSTGGYETLEVDRKRIQLLHERDIAAQRTALRALSRELRQSSKFRDRAGCALLETFGEEALARIPDEARLVFSSEPTPRQNPLPSFPRWFVDELCALQAERKAEGLARMRSSQREFEIQQMTLPPIVAEYERSVRESDNRSLGSAEPFFRSLVSLRKGSSDISANLTFYNREGLPTVLESVQIRGFKSAETHELSGRGSGRQLDLPPDVLSAADVRSNTPHVRKSILELGKEDALLETSSAVCHLLAEDVGGNIIISVPSSFYGTARRNRTAKELFAYLERDCESRVKPGWLSYRDRKANIPTDRHLVAKCLSRVANLKPTFEDWAAVAADLKQFDGSRPALDLFEQLRIALRIRAFDLGEVGSVRRVLLQTYGYLTDQQREALNKGGFIELGKLELQTRRSLDELIRFNPEPMSVVDILYRANQTLEENTKCRLALMDCALYQNLPTVRLADGWPLTTKLSLSTKDKNDFTLRLDGGFYGFVETFRLRPVPGEDG